MLNMDGNNALLHIFFSTVTFILSVSEVWHISVILPEKCNAVCLFQAEFF